MQFTPMPTFAVNVHFLCVSRRVFFGARVCVWSHSLFKFCVFGYNFRFALNDAYTQTPRFGVVKQFGECKTLILQLDYYQCNHFCNMGLELPPFKSHRFLSGCFFGGGNIYLDCYNEISFIIWQWQTYTRFAGMRHNLKL